MKSVDVMLLYEYTNILTGMQKNFSDNFFTNQANKNEQDALSVFRYAIEIFMRVKNKKAVESILNAHMLKRMKLENLMTYIRIPTELSEKDRMSYLAHMLYPSDNPYNQHTLAINTYKRLLDGDLYKFPKGYFDDADGERKACYCLVYMIERFFEFNSTKEMYEYFAFHGMDAMGQYKLRQVCIDVFESPLEYLHAALPRDQKDDFWYSYYNVVSSYNLLPIKAVS